LRLRQLQFRDCCTCHHNRRQGLGLSQQAFATAYKIPLATLKGWEQGRRQPDATASAYLSVIARLPDAARQVLRAA